MASYDYFFVANDDEVALKAHEYYTALRHGGGIVDEAYIIANVCERYGWTWQEYHSQPYQFLQTIVEKMRVEQEVEQELRRDQERQQ